MENITVLISSFLGRGQRWRLVALVALFFVAGCTVELYPPAQEVNNLPDGGKVDVLPDTIPRAFAFGPRIYWSQIVASDSAYSIAVTDANNKGRWLDSLRWVPSGPFVTVNGDTLSTRAYARDNSGVTGDNQVLTYNGSGSLTIESGNTVDMSDLLDNTDAQTIDTFLLSGNILSLSIESDGEAAKTVDLSGYLDNTDAQTIDTLTLQGDTMLQVSLSGDGAPVKELDLSALRSVVDSTRLAQDSILVYYQDGAEVGRDTIAGVGGGGADNLGDHTMTQNLQTNGNWISGDGGNEGISVDATGKVGIGTLTPLHPLDVSGKIGINGTQMLYYPGGSFTNTMFVGNGGANTIYTGGFDGRYNTFLGIDAGLNITRGFGNVGVGEGSLRADSTGNYNVAIGRRALYSNITGSENIGIGFSALYSNTTASENYAIGRNALYSNTTGSSNYALGKDALRFNTTGSYNTGIGWKALYSNTIGAFNTGIGYAPLYFNTTGSNNFGLGFRALYENTTGSNSVAIGWNAMSRNTTGQRSIAIGTSAGSFIADGVTGNTTGSFSVYIGNEARVKADGETNQIVIGASAIGNGSNTSTIGSSSIVHHYLSGTGQVKIPGGTTAQRQAGENGDLRFSSTNNRLEAYYNAQWNTIASEEIEDDGSASDTTDGSGDITVSHTLGSASITVTATTTGTTFYHVQVHTKTSTTFKIRFFDAAGAAVTSTAVTADWIAKLQ